MLGIINYNSGNLASVQNAILKLGGEVRIESNPEKLKSYDRLILPGVGAFGEAMEHLEKSGMKESILEFAKSGKPLLGICLGMQLLFQKSYEFGEHLGLGLIEGEIIKFDKKLLKEDEKIPHMGWNLVQKTKNSPLLKDLEETFYLYFVHSYYLGDFKNAIGISHYGVDFTALVQKDNLLGIQPHPEKSHNVGLKILENFLKFS
ncbi:imidazole glycerol phosphate synthase subunit HisH [Helicobacter canadensis]|uniref:Imidazole glycerol phosphate synthase subunit HisH n=2 Tax=Helicobacter canadensis TaxID=123841 RepID=C5ZV06_9HELI|nr:imidazole glycerol phosphate synthase subunit HisH [Helicobacter canadensis]EES88820.1 Imidazole glycerol phosphate synthase subunit hisH [Helicobacter canadensis MIT 98-5491]STP00086.1 imidazole glycerol phosphate synthase subunit [Helicobacter canadensis]